MGAMVFLVTSSAAWIALAALDRLLRGERPAAAWDVTYHFVYQDGVYRYVDAEAIPTNLDGPSPEQIAEMRRRWSGLHFGPRKAYELRSWVGIDLAAEDYGATILSSRLEGSVNDSDWTFRVIRPDEE